MEIKPVAFEALIKSISVKSLVSGDKEAELKLRFIPSDNLLDGLNRLHRADGVTKIKIEENE